VSKSLALLVGGTFVAWALVAYPARVWWGESALLFSGTAALLCLLPSAVTLAWAHASFKGQPHQQVAAVLGGAGLRMLFVVVGGLVLYHSIPEFFYVRFWIWVIAFYLLTLALEMFLLTRRAGPKPAAKDQSCHAGVLDGSPVP
jgi:hypothetical protein